MSKFNIEDNEFEGGQHGTAVRFRGDKGSVRFVGNKTTTRIGLDIDTTTLTDDQQEFLRLIKQYNITKQEFIDLVKTASEDHDQGALNTDQIVAKNPFLGRIAVAADLATLYQFAAMIVASSQTAEVLKELF